VLAVVPIKMPKPMMTNMIRMKLIKRSRLAVPRMVMMLKMSHVSVKKTSAIPTISVNTICKATSNSVDE
jgi:hypothetical protein